MPDRCLAYVRQETLCLSLNCLLGCFAGWVLSDKTPYPSINGKSAVLRNNPQNFNALIILICCIFSERVLLDFVLCSFDLAVVFAGSCLKNVSISCKYDINSVSDPLRNLLDTELCMVVEIADMTVPVLRIPVPGCGLANDLRSDKKICLKIFIDKT